MISIIVPIYNLETKITRCVTSLMRQSYRDFEIILVDDGSTDRSGRICDDFAEKDQRIRVIHKKNGGVSSARNTGLENAKGEYVAFVDGDDMVAVDFLEKLRITEEDLSIGSAYYADAKGNILSAARKEKACIEPVTPRNIARWFENGSLYSVWSNLFRISLIRNMKLKFDEMTTRGEDTIFMFEYVSSCKKVRFTDDFVYYYVQYGKGGSSSSLLNANNIRALDYLDQYLTRWFDQNGIKSAVFSDADFWTKQELRNYCYEVIRDRTIGPKDKYSYFCMFFDLPTFSDTLFKKSKPHIRFIMNRRSPVLLIICSWLIGLYPGNRNGKRSI